MVSKKKTKKYKFNPDSLRFEEMTKKEQRVFLLDKVDYHKGEVDYEQKQLDKYQSMLDAIEADELVDKILQGEDT